MLRNTSTEKPEKEVGKTQVDSPLKILCYLESQEQKLIEELRRTFGDNQITESRIQYEPRWIVEKAIQKKKENYAENKAYKEVNARRLPRDANLIILHCFSQIKTDRESNKLKLKCLFVPYANKDTENNDFRKDFSSAQFPVNRVVFSATPILQLILAKIDIFGPYLQSGSLKRDLYVHVP